MVSTGPVLHFDAGVAILTGRLNQEALSSRRGAGADGRQPQAVREARDRAHDSGMEPQRRRGPGHPAGRGGHREREPVAARGAGRGGGHGGVPLRLLRRPGAARRADRGPAGPAQPRGHPRGGGPGPGRAFRVPHGHGLRRGHDDPALRAAHPRRPHVRARLGRHQGRGSGHDARHEAAGRCGGEAAADDPLRRLSGRGVPHERVPATSRPGSTWTPPSSPSRRTWK